MSSATSHRRLARRRDEHHESWAVCSGRFVVAPLWVAYGVNLGTLLRTCDAVGACIAVPDTAHYRDALDRGDTLPYRPCIHWIREGKDGWVAGRRARGWRIVVELAPQAVPLAELPAADAPTVVLLGNESVGVPHDHVGRADVCVEIPMLGLGHSLNVAVAGSLVLYKLAGLT